MAKLLDRKLSTKSSMKVGRKPAWHRYPKVNSYQYKGKPYRVGDSVILGNTAWRATDGEIGNIVGIRAHAGKVKVGVRITRLPKTEPIWAYGVSMVRHFQYRQPRRSVGGTTNLGIK